MWKSFKDRRDKEFPDTPCPECATSLLPRNHKLEHSRTTHKYGITRVFGVLVTGESGGVILCENCCKEPQAPINGGHTTQYNACLPWRSTLFISPFQLGHESREGFRLQLSHSSLRVPYLSGAITTNPINV